jgi:hypothetical protein
MTSATTLFTREIFEAVEIYLKADHTSGNSDVKLVIALLRSLSTNFEKRYNKLTESIK